MKWIIHPDLAIERQTKISHREGGLSWPKKYIYIDIEWKG